MSTQTRVTLAQRLCTCGVQSDRTILHECPACRGWRLRYTPQRRASTGRVWHLALEDLQSKAQAAEVLLDTLLAEREALRQSKDVSAATLTPAVRKARENLRRLRAALWKAQRAQKRAHAREEAI